MKQDRLDRLLATLRSASGAWVTAAALSKRVGTTERTVRNYISELNARGTAHIESSRLGYRLVEGEDGAALPKRTARTPQSAEDREYFVLSRIINAKSPVSVFDLSDELSVSESTLSGSTIPRLRKLLARFDLILETHDFTIAIRGSEENLRRLVGYAATHGHGSYFTSVRIIKQMFPGYDIDRMLERLVDICQESGLFLNNYALYNLLMHLIVILVRLRSGSSLDQKSPVATNQIVRDLRHREAIIHCMDRIEAYCIDSFHLRPSREDYRQVVTLIALSSDFYAQGELARDRLVEIVGQAFFGDVVGALDALRDRYRLAEFDEDFILQFSLHLHNAYQRVVYGVSCPNPIAAQLKQDYAPVYDMAVFVIHRLSQSMGVSFSEDEIGFIAYHLGSYLESHKPGNQRTSCVVIFESYHGFADSFMATLEDALHGELEVLATLGVDEYLRLLPACDMVITTIGFPYQHSHTVLVSPILSNRNVRKIRGEIDSIRHERRSTSALTYLQKYLAPELYLRNLRVDGVEDCIRALGRLCCERGFITEEFVEDVLLRERVSNTAFTDILAVPHPINKFALRSFVCVLHNDEPIPWGGRAVNFVLMIGLSPQDTHFFQDMLDLVIDLFLSPERSMQALASDTYGQFMAVLTASDTT